MLELFEKQSGGENAKRICFVSMPTCGARGGYFSITKYQWIKRWPACCQGRALVNWVEKYSTCKTWCNTYYNMSIFLREFTVCVSRLFSYNLPHISFVQIGQIFLSKAVHEGAIFQENLHVQRWISAVGRSASFLLSSGSKARIRFFWVLLVIILRPSNVCLSEMLHYM